MQCQGRTGVGSCKVRVLTPLWPRLTAEFIHESHNPGEWENGSVSRTPLILGTMTRAVEPECCATPMEALGGEMQDDLERLKQTESFWGHF